MLNYEKENISSDLLRKIVKEISEDDSIRRIYKKNQELGNRIVSYVSDFMAMTGATSFEFVTGE